MKFNFIKHASSFVILSIVLTVVGSTLIFFKGLRYGIDFSGGNEIQIQFKSTPDVDRIRDFLSQEGYPKAQVQSFGTENEVLIRMEETQLEKVVFLTEKIGKKYKAASIRRVDAVGPQIGSELKQKGLLAVCYSLILILIYLGLRFNYKYAPSAVFCLFHDSILTLSVFVLLNREVNIQTLAAILAIIGYSLNDTIVTFDRIRENVELYAKKKTFAEICNQSLNDVLSRSLLTSITTMIAVGAMWFLTSGVIKDFAFTLGIGIVIGTYSSIYVATPLVLYLDKWRIRS